MTVPLSDRLVEESIKSRPTKRLKSAAAPTSPTSLDQENDCDGTFVRRHPLGIRPSGNAFTSTHNLKSSCGNLTALPDELLVQILEILQAHDLLRLGGTCRALHGFTRSEELWRALFVESSPLNFSWRGTWRSTFLSQDTSAEPRVDCSYLFSDVLHRPFFCAHVPLNAYATHIPSQNQITRFQDLTFEAFAAEWVFKPFILTDPVKRWPVYKTWSTERLLEKHADTPFRAEAVDWPLKTYVEYMNSSRDESPLYLFDRAFAEKMQLVVATDADDVSADYWPPTCYGPDLFSVLGEQRPDHRWLIVGPVRSGSTFHKDPNATSAWNAVLKGSKYWIMFPSSPSIPPPPGVYVSDDQSEVTSPLSIAEWLLGFHAEARQTPGCKEGICGEGEVLYVPSGWYHLVLNLEPSIAITQNLVPRSRAGAVLHFLRDQKQSISGFGDDVADPYGLFVERLREHDPELLEVGLNDADRLNRHSKGGKWEELKKPIDEEDAQQGGGFSFGFGDDDDAEVP